MELRPERVMPVTLGDVAAAAGAQRVVSPAGVDPSTVLVTGATIDSRSVRPGDLFGAFAGEAVHGASFATGAAAAGAVAVLTDEAGAPAAAAAGLPVIVCANARRSMGFASAFIYGSPCASLSLVGITGTNGKTTTSFLVEGALAALGKPTALLGTVQMRLGDEIEAATRTTVEAPVLQGFLARAVERGVRHAITEVSSQAISLERAAGAHCAIALFTNLQYEHMDYHHTMEAYFAEKARLFTPELTDRAVVLVDDAWGQRLAREATVPVVTVATRDGAAPADWSVSDAAPADGGGMTFTLTGPDGRSHRVACPLPGAINVSNAAGAVVVAHELGVPIDDAIAGLARSRPVPGRSEVVTQRTATTPLTVVDYAHTPDGVAAVLEAMRGITPGRLFVVFGCDGLRDDSKRPGLGAAAAEHADVVIVTDENPRTEPPEYIRARILEGVDAARPGRTEVFEISPRVDAVLHAIRMATPADTIIATGKGHETTQEINGVHYPYTDAAAFTSALATVAAERDGRAG